MFRISISLDNDKKHRLDHVILHTQMKGINIRICRCTQQFEHNIELSVFVAVYENIIFGFFNNIGGTVLPTSPSKKKI